MWGAGTARRASPWPKHSPRRGSPASTSMTPPLPGPGGRRWPPGCAARRPAPRSTCCWGCAADRLAVDNPAHAGDDSTMKGPSSLVGRGPPLGGLGTALDAALAGHGSLVLITGEPGIGKTALV